ncbi:hypothetical protein SCUCBS95973_008556 [Sporothrix curviconia]|uniref:Endonuclease/exonuclease/phosphatase domain-containing protein n=1 Tax=Sporothrix curviconia TaxID=1260050 RepID=A0ABP0CQ44_9PEZI
MASSTSSDLPPLPEASNTKAIPLSWFGFDRETGRWEKVPVADTTGSPPVLVELDDAQDDAGDSSKSSSKSNSNDQAAPDLLAVTWNIDAYGYEHAKRLRSVLLRSEMTLKSVGAKDVPSAASAAPAAAATSTTSRPQSWPVPDVYFLQEVSGIAKRTLLDYDFIRDDYYISGVDWMLKDVGHPFYNATLLSRHRFTPELTTDARKLTLGRVWMVNLPSRYGRYALCCDVVQSARTTLRLVNVHLDSLPARPSHRPRQLATVADMLKATGVAAGVVAGDFNPVIPEEDDGLVAANGLTDCWLKLKGPGKGDEPGFTWGVSRKERFPPIRMDKVAIVNNSHDEVQVLQAKEIGLLEPTFVKMDVPTRTGGVLDDEPEVLASDHLGIWVRFGLK